MSAGIFLNAISTHLPRPDGCNSLLMNSRHADAMQAPPHTASRPSAASIAAQAAGAAPKGVPCRPPTGCGQEGEIAAAHTTYSLVSASDLGHNMFPKTHAGPGRFHHWPSMSTPHVHSPTHTAAGFSPCILCCGAGGAPPWPASPTGPGPPWACLLWPCRRSGRPLAPTGAVRGGEVRKVMS